jgi:tRNA nucleotidyltransferase (CCA-adding enzyme)
VLPDTLQNAVVPEHVLRVVTGLQERGYAAYLVGGCVRDILRGAVPKDYDVATAALPDQVRQAFPKVIPTGIQHGTVTVLSGSAQVEVTTFRSEGAYFDGRHPSTVTFETEIQADLSRRDFTINAMAFDPKGRVLVDPFRGQGDLDARRIRCVGDPHERFSEDGLRPMRAVRFAAVLGYELDPATFDAMAPALGAFAKVSLERVREELSKLLTSERPGLGLDLLRRSGMLAVFLPELGPFASEWPLVVAAAPLVSSSVEQRLAVLLLPLRHPPDARTRIRELIQRSKFPNAVADAVSLRVASVPNAPADPARSDADLRRWAASVGSANVEPVLEIVLALARAEAGPQRAANVSALQNRLHAILEARPPLSPRELALHGQEIMVALGVGPSPAVGEATRFLFDQVLERPDLNAPEALRKLLAGWRKQRP